MNTQDRSRAEEPSAIDKFMQRRAQCDAAIQAFTRTNRRPPTRREIAFLMKTTNASKEGKEQT